MQVINIKATDLQDAWFQCLYNIIEHGRTFTIDKGSYAGQERREFDYVTLQIDRPWERCADGLPLIPQMPAGCDIPAPTTKKYIRSYADYLMSAEKAESEQYTYGERLCRATVPNSGLTPENVADLIDDGKVDYYGYTPVDTAYEINILWINQIEWIIDAYKRHGYRNNQMVLQVAQPSDLLLSDPPCLRHIDTRIQDGRLHFFPYFRSWDLWGGLPSNLAGISLLQEYMAGEIGIEQGEMICSSKGLHLYGYAVDLAKIRCMSLEKT